MNLQKGKHTPGIQHNQQPRGTYTSPRLQGGLPSGHLTQVQRLDDYSRQGSGYQQPVVQGLPRHYPLGSVATSVPGGAHDMSKQATLQPQAQNAPGLYAPSSASAGVSGVGGPQQQGNNQQQQQVSSQQQSSGGMPGATPVSSSPHPGAAGPRQQQQQQGGGPPQQVVQQHQQQQQQGNRQMYFQPNNVVRTAMHPRAAQWGPHNAMSHTAQPQQQQQYSSPLQQAWFNPGSHFTIPNMQMMSRGNGQPAVTQIINYPGGQVNAQYSPNAAAAAQYQQLAAASGQQQMIFHTAQGNANPAAVNQAGGGYVYGHHQRAPAAAGYYNALPQMNQLNYQMYSQQQGMRSLQNVAQPPPPTLPVKEKSIIMIQDPDTFMDVTNSLLFGDKNNANQRESATHQPSDIAIEFAAKVASVATPISSSRNVQENQQQTIQQQQQTQIQQQSPSEVPHLEALRLLMASVQKHPVDIFPPNTPVGGTASDSTPATPTAPTAPTLPLAAAIDPTTSSSSSVEGDTPPNLAQSDRDLLYTRRPTLPVGEAPVVSVYELGHPIEPETLQCVGGPPIHHHHHHHHSSSGVVASASSETADININNAPAATIMTEQQQPTSTPLPPLMAPALDAGVALLHQPGPVVSPSYGLVVEDGNVVVVATEGYPSHPPLNNVYPPNLAAVASSSMINATAPSPPRGVASGGSYTTVVAGGPLAFSSTNRPAQMGPSNPLLPTPPGAAPLPSAAGVTVMQQQQTKSINRSEEEMIRSSASASAPGGQQRIGFVHHHNISNNASTNAVVGPHGAAPMIQGHAGGPLTTPLASGGPQIISDTCSSVEQQQLLLLNRTSSSTLTTISSFTNKNENEFASVVSEQNVTSLVTNSNNASNVIVRERNSVTTTEVEITSEGRRSTSVTRTTTALTTEEDLGVNKTASGAALGVAGVDEDETDLEASKKLKFVQQNGDLSTGGVSSAAVGTTIGGGTPENVAGFNSAASKEDADGRDSKKVSKAKKMKELNRKGESKEGSEMDAFVDHRQQQQRDNNNLDLTVVGLVSPLPGNNNNNNIPMVPPSPSKLSSGGTPPLINTSPLSSAGPLLMTDDVTSVVDTSLALHEVDSSLEEERKVAEKNEENKRFSQEVVSATTPDDAAGQPNTDIIDTNKTPKYQYKEDQWSPLNPEGKKHYDRAFLIMLQSQPMSLQKPKGLPDLDVIKDRAMQLNLPDHNRTNVSSIQPQVIHRNQHDMFMPQYARGGSGAPRHPQSGGGGGGVNRRQSQQGRDKPKKIIAISSSLNEDVKLHAAPNAWKPGYKFTPEELDAETAKTEDLYKRVRGILNKLTPQKFTTLVEQVKDLPIDTEARLTGVIDLVFEKAVDEPNFSVPYANMCKHLMKKAVPSEIEGTNVNFRKLLLTKCQREFERDKNDVIREQKNKEIAAADSEDKKKIIKEELADEERKARRRSLGNIRFIGELYKLHMLTANIMHDCLQKLMKERDEDSLECLCRLLTTIGKELDEKKMEKGEKPNKHMDNYMDNMRKVVELKTTTSRVRFMLQDVMELRKRQWVPRREENNPKTIDQIHIEAEREAINQQQLLAQTPMQPLNKRMDDRDNRDGRRKNRPFQEEQGGWSTVGGQGKNRSAFTTPTYDNKPPKISAKPFDDSIQLGPGGRGFSSWSRGSSGGSTSKTLGGQDNVSASTTSSSGGGGGGSLGFPSDNKSSTPSNRFHALQDAQDTKRHEMTSSPSFNKSSSSARRDVSSGRAGSQGPPGNNNQGLRKSTSQISARESRDRENAIAAVKAISDQQQQTPGVTAPSAGGLLGTPSGGALLSPGDVPLAADATPSSTAADQRKKEQLVGGSSLAATTPTGPPPPQMTGPTLTVDQMETKVAPLLAEFLHTLDFEEAISCLLELTSSASVPLFVTSSINYVLELSSQSRLMVGQLMQKLLTRRIISIAQYVEGFQSILELADELEIDIPTIWKCLAELVASMVQDGGVSMAFLREALKEHRQDRVAAKLMPPLLQLISKNTGSKRVYELWQAAGLQWSYFLMADQNEQEFINKNHLECTQIEVKSSLTTSISADETRKTLDFLLRKQGCQNEEIFDWIEANIGRDQIQTPRFVRALVTAVIESATKLDDGRSAIDTKILKERILLLQKYLENREHLELQALYAIQAIVHKMQHPKGMLASIFEVVYDEDAISEDAFTQWEKSNDPAEQEGKGVALKSATSFFTWLNEAEEDSGD